jgi:hypothetical protein
VKALYLVMAIRDHFGQPSERAAAAQDALDEIRNIVNEAHPGSSENKVHEVAQVAYRTPVAETSEERWVVSIITTNRIQVRLSRLFSTCLMS